MWSSSEGSQLSNLQEYMTQSPDHSTEMWSKAAHHMLTLISTDESRTGLVLECESWHMKTCNNLLAPVMSDNIPAGVF